MEVEDCKKLLTTCNNYDEVIKFIIKNSQKIKELNLLLSNYNELAFVSLSNVLTLKLNNIIKTKVIVIKENIKKRDMSNDILGTYLYQKNPKKERITQMTINDEVIIFSEFIKKIYDNDNGIIINSDVIMKNSHYRKYFIKEFLALVIHDENLKLSDFDISKFVIDNANQTVTINNVSIRINLIKSLEIKTYCTSKLVLSDDIIC
jgi:hypothetical protein